MRAQRRGVPRDRVHEARLGPECAEDRHGTAERGDAARLGVISDDEARLLREVEALTARVIAVDHFDPAEVKPHYMTPGHNARAVQTAAAE